MVPIADILLVEDNPDDRVLTLHTLHRAGLTPSVAVVQDGVEALDILFRTGAYAHRALHDLPKLVLLDVWLPRMSGLEVLHCLKAEPHTQGIPVLLFLAEPEDRATLPPHDPAADGYLSKPLDMGQFWATVQQLGLYWLLGDQPAR